MDRPVLNWYTPILCLALDEPKSNEQTQANSGELVVCLGHIGMELD